MKNKDWLKENWFKISIVIILVLVLYYIGIRPSYLVKKCRGDIKETITIGEMRNCLASHGYPIELQINM